MTQKLLTEQEWHRLTRPVRIPVGRYHGWKPTEEHEFSIELGAQPLARIAEDAATGRRVYEFMAIRRPGEVLRYLAVRMDAMAPDSSLRSILDRLHEDRIDDDGWLPFLKFDESFQWDFDDTPPHDRVYLEHRSSTYWPGLMSELLEVVRSAQARLRCFDDPLLQHELALIENGRHRRDFWPDWRIESHPLPIPHGLNKPASEAVRELFLELIKRDDIRSVSCPFPDYALWRGLVAEQVKRAMATGLPLQQAFCLCGPDSGLGEAIVEDWGGEVHIPYEGACGSDLFILPEWFRFSPEKIREGGKLTWATWGKGCNHVLVRGDHGEVACATRKRIGEWTLYSSKDPYVDCNPFYGAESACLGA